MAKKHSPSNQNIDLLQAVETEGEKFQKYYIWLENSMPRAFFEEVSRENLLLITQSLMGFDLQDYFSTINRKNAVIAMCLDSPDADLRILRHYAGYGIKNYQAHVSREPAPFPGIVEHLRIATIEFTEAVEIPDKTFSIEAKTSLINLIKKNNPNFPEEEFEISLEKMDPRFLLALPPERLALAVNLLYRAQSRDSCQYEVRYEENWQEKGTASMYIILAWRNTPKHNFLYRLARVVFRHGLSMKRVNAIYTDPYSKKSVLVMALSLHGSNGEAAWDVADIPDFIREMATLKYFDDFDQIDETLVTPKIITGNMGNLLRAMVSFIHQSLVNIDSNLYTIEHVEEALCRHPELTLLLCQAFQLKFDPNYQDLNQYEEVKKRFLSDVTMLDTGQESNDTRRKNVLFQGMNFVVHTLKTNFYRLNYIALSFRLDPKYLDDIPFDRAKKFPELPYGIFFIKGMHFFGFHIRFKDLARGGLRTIYPEQIEQMVAERNHVFTECYHLAWTQHKKNKDIPEGGAKAVIFLQPFSQIDSESPIFKKELEWLKIDSSEIEHRINAFRHEQKLEFLYQSQRAFIDSFVTIINCDSDGKIRARFILDYWKRPEYIYLGPDENMHDFMIEWIANFSKKYDYKPGRAFISSKPKGGINHKEYGVTSLGVNVYMHQVLEYMGIDPYSDQFTVKMSGGPDGDVAGNQLLNLYHHYPKTAKLIALTDGTGTIFDENGLDLEAIKDLFYEAKGICYYPPEKLSNNGFLVHKHKKRFPTPYTQETLCWRKSGDKVVEDWLSGSDTNHLLHYNVHQAKTDIFIPAGGRPRTLNESNISEFLDENGIPTSRAIIEGANLYLDSHARHFLESKGVLIIKDSSANKGGVICSSFEVLCGLAIPEETFIEQKEQLVSEILERVKLYSFNEANLLLKTHSLSGESLTSISDRLSNRINLYTYQLLDYLDTQPLPTTTSDPIIQCFLNYCLPTLREHYTNELLSEIPEHHKKAIISTHLACSTVYRRGLEWSPSIVDVLPLILNESYQHENA
ncbi:MAG: NAD-glutamate dehydrogenase [Parachlamydiaceae bacterium]|nr:NAD-glutamate dehydrogenase [Parachlamydiaceae bacterium]